MKQAIELLKKEAQNFKIKNKELGHLGIIAGVIKKNKIEEHIDKALPVSEKKGAQITMGKRVSSMIYNALGFTDSRCYLFPKFMKQKALSRLMGPGILPQHFNDDAIGRCLDAIYNYGPTKLFSEIVLKIAKKNKLLGKSMHIDSTSLKLYGNYENKEAPEAAIKVTHGYSKDHRPDLKQVVLTLVTNNKANLPIFMEGKSGNASDHKILIQAAKQIEIITKKIKDTPSFIYVADSAMYESCLDENLRLLWLSRVPAQRKEAKKFIANHSQYHLKPIVGTGYKIYTEEKTVKNIKQRWALVFSEKAYQRECKTLEKRVIKEKETYSKKLKRLCSQKFSCQKDAEKVLKKFMKEVKYHALDEVNFVISKEYNKKGRPSKLDLPKGEYVRIQTKLKTNDQKYDEIKKNKGYFILATNQLDSSLLSNEEMLQEYKGQQKTERGFAFIKDKTFEVSSVFLKKETRIEALLMIMALSLFIYSLIQHHLREQLKEKNEFIPSQTDRPIQNPTAKWIFFLLKPIQELTLVLPDISLPSCISHLDELAMRIIGYYGQETMDIYGIGTPK